jgi:hypothetical protein
MAAIDPTVEGGHADAQQVRSGALRHGRAELPSKRDLDLPQLSSEPCVAGLLDRQAQAHDGLQQRRRGSHSEKRNLSWCSWLAFANFCALIT